MNRRIHAAFLINAVVVATAAAAAEPEPPLGTIQYPEILADTFADTTLAGSNRYVAVGKPNFFDSRAFGEEVLVYSRLAAEILAVFRADDPNGTFAYAADLALWNDLLFVSGMRGGDNGPSSGFVDVYDLTTRTRITTLREPVTGTDDLFGFEIASAGNRLAVSDPVVGFPGKDSGRMYVYSLPDLTLLYEITATNTVDQTFPLQMALSDQYIVAISGRAEDVGTTEPTFFVYDAATGATLAAINPVIDGEPIMQFFGDLAVSDRYALAADVNSDRQAPGGGEVYVFDLHTMEFVSSVLPPPADDPWFMGASIAVRGDTAVIGSPQSMFDGLPGLFDVVRLPHGELLNRFDAYTRENRRVDNMTNFGRSLALAVGGVVVSSDFDPWNETLVDWIPLAEICPADTTRDGLLTPIDYGAWIVAFGTGDPACDQNNDGACTPADFSAWIINYNAGC